VVHPDGNAHGSAQSPIYIDYIARVAERERERERLHKDVTTPNSGR
jgi:hypothetical protein